MTFEDLNEDEIRFLIRRYSNFLKELKRELKKRLSIVGREDIGEWDASAEAKMLATDVLEKLGFTKNKHYRREVIDIIDKLYKDYGWNKIHSSYANEELAIAVVKEVLTHYNVNVMYDDVISMFGCDANRLDKLYMRVHAYCVDKYWKDIPR